jgi:2-succinyl-6-hydroxy-2,4-cyclohexadiene-1-carboxylate synthase
MYVSTDNGDYWVEVYGRGVPVLLLHGFTGSRSTWNYYVDRWKDKFQLIVLDLPGHGKTNVFGQVSMEECCRDISMVLDRLSIDKVHLIGYSMGGRTALSFTMLHRNKVASLVLESASPGLAELHEQIGRQTKDEALANKIEQDGIENFVDYWENISLFQSQQSLPYPVRQAIREERLSHSPQGLSYSLKGMGTGKQPSWWDKLANLSINVLVIVGEYDQKFINLAQKMDDSFRYSQLEVIKAAGHAVHVEQPKIFDTIVSDFINQQVEGGFNHDS